MERDYQREWLDEKFTTVIKSMEEIKALLATTQENADDAHTRIDKYENMIRGALYAIPIIGTSLVAGAIWLLKYMNQGNLHA